MNELGALKGFHFRCDAETRQGIEKLAHRWKIGYSAALRYAVQRALEADGMLDGFAPDAATLQPKPGPKRGHRRPPPARGAPDGGQDG